MWGKLSLLECWSAAGDFGDHLLLSLDVMLSPPSFLAQTRTFYENHLKRIMSHSIILDIGSGSIKGGRGSDSLPPLVMPSVAGAAPKKVNILKKKAAEEDALAGRPYLVGHEAIANVGKVTVEAPIDRGVVKNWQQVEHMLRQAFEDLEAIDDLPGVGVVLTQPSYHPLANSETLAQLMFESFDSGSLAFVTQGSCALYASGRTTGVVLESGEGITQVLPIFDSMIVTTGGNRINFGGKEVTDHFSRILFEKGYCFTGPADRFTVQRMKEELCIVSGDYSADLAKAEEELEDFELPDGQMIGVGKERFRASEILFNPGILHSELPSLAEFVSTSVKACGIDVRPHLLGNIVLSGGNTLFGGFAERLKEDVLKSFPGFGGVKVIDSPDRKFGVWVGASVLAGLSSFSESVITKDVYDENGPSIVHNYRRKVEAPDNEEAA